MSVETNDRGQTVVLGAGPAGLGAAWRLSSKGFPVSVFEVKPTVGGLAGTFQHGPYALDFGPHKFYTRFGYVLDLVRSLLGKDLLTVPKVSAIWLRGKRLNYPFGMKDLVFGLGPWVAFRSGSSYGLATLTGKFGKRQERTYEDYVVNRFGKFTYDLVFSPLAGKIWGPPKTLDANLARVRIVIPSMIEMLKRMIFGDGGKPELSAKIFYYPRKGFSQIWDALVKLIQDKGGLVETQVRPTRIQKDGDHFNVTVKTATGDKTIRAAHVISSIPMTSLLEIMDPPPPKEVLDAAKRLRYRAIILGFVVIQKPRAGQDAWVFFPESEYIFNRISEQKGFSEEMIPPDRTVVTVDISCTEGDAVWQLSEADLKQRVILDLAKTGLLTEGDVLEFFSMRVPKVYPVYDTELKKNVDVIWPYLDSLDHLVAVGRHGHFQHNNSDNAIDMGVAAADLFIHRKTSKDWALQRERFDDYQIVD